MSEPISNLDPVTLTVIQNGLIQVCNEMDLAFVRSAFSPVISEGMDRSDGIYDATDGSLRFAIPLAAANNTATNNKAATNASLHRMIVLLTGKDVGMRNHCPNQRDPSRM